MNNKEDFLNVVLESLSHIEGIRSKAMFGGYGIFHEDDMFALIKGNRLFLKVDDTNRADYEMYDSPQYKPMPYFKVPDEIFKKPDSLVEWAQISIGIAHATSKKKSR